METYSNVCTDPSSNTITHQYWELDGELALFDQITAAFFVLYAAIGLPWNIFVIITILRKKLYLQPTIMLLLDLALTDILLEIPMVKIITTGIAGEYVFGNSDNVRCLVCRIGGLKVSLAMNCIFVIAVMSVDRFLFIYKPLLYERKSNKLCMLVAIILTALLSLFLGLLSLIEDDLIGFRKKFLTCIPNLKHNWHSTTLIIFASIALAVIVTCNVGVICIAQKNIKAIYGARNSIKNDQQLTKRLKKERHKKQIHLFRVFGLLIFTNIISWMPKIVIFLILQFKEESDIPSNFFLVAQILFFIQVVIHPMLETCIISDVREPLKHMVTCNILKHQQVSLDSAEDGNYFRCCADLKDSNIKCFYWFNLLTASVIPHNYSTNHTNSSSTSHTGLEGSCMDKVTITKL